MSKSIKEKLDIFENEIIIKENLENIIGDRFGRYSKYIIQDRALPDCRDGLKPVQRRILYAMYKLGMFSDKPFKKSARIVGEVIGKYHPHGDSSVYDAMVRLSQTWKIRNLLIDMHGNNGSVDGDSAAAMRYTEARLSKISELLLMDIDKRTVDFIPNFDDEEYEPTVLPSRFPNLLVNGATGISAGYATEIPPHNLSEIIEATIKRIDNPNSVVSDFLSIIKGPDFPTGATVQGIDEIKKAYETGKGRIIIKSNTEIINNQIIITEIPYEINKANLVRKIDQIRISKKIDGIQEVRDETDRDGLRIVIDIKKNANPDFILTYLLKTTDLSRSYNFNMVAIDNKRPRVMGLLDILDAYILHQKQVVTNRSNYELKKAKKRLHVVEGIIKMIDIIDDVINTIRSSKNKKDAKDNLLTKYNFSEEQSEAIVTLQLYKLSSTDINDLLQEEKSLNKKIEMLNKILKNESVLEKVIKDELSEIKNKFTSKRRTIIEEEIEKIVIVEEDLITNEPCKVSISKDGYIKRSSIRSYSAVKNDLSGLKENDAVLKIFDLNTKNTLLLFTNRGNYIYLPVYKIPDIKWKDLGEHINNLVRLKENEKIINAIRIDNFDEEKYILLCTKLGQVKRTKLQDFNINRYSRPIKAIGLKKNDEVRAADISNEIETDTVIVSKKGFIIRFSSAETPILSTQAVGVKAISLRTKDEVGTALFTPSSDDENNDLLVLTNRGTIKRIKLSQIERTSRAVKGKAFLKEIKSNPYFAVSSVILSQEQYKEKVKINIITENKNIFINAFDIKIDKSDNGRQFVKNNVGKSLFLFIDEVQEDLPIPIKKANNSKNNINSLKQNIKKEDKVKDEIDENKSSEVFEVDVGDIYEEEQDLEKAIEPSEKEVKELNEQDEETTEEIIVISHNEQNMLQNEDTKSELEQEDEEKDDEDLESLEVNIQQTLF